MTHPALLDLPLASRDLASWFHHGEQVLALLDAQRPAVIVELGTWRGASAIAMARVARTWGGTVTCVDTWMGDVNGGIRPGCPDMLTDCAWNVISRGMAASVRFIPALTTDAADWWVGPIDFLYVDADHSYESVNADLESWWPHVRSGGLVVGDDYQSPLYPGLTAAWDDFEARHGLTLARVPTPNTTPPGMALIYGVKP